MPTDPSSHYEPVALFAYTPALKPGTRNSSLDRISSCPRRRKLRNHPPSLLQQGPLTPPISRKVPRAPFSSLTPCRSFSAPTTPWRRSARCRRRLGFPPVRPTCL